MAERTRPTELTSALAILLGILLQMLARLCSWKPSVASCCCCKSGVFSSILAREELPSATPKSPLSASPTKVSELDSVLSLMPASVDCNPSLCILPDDGVRDGGRLAGGVELRPERMFRAFIAYVRHYGHKREKEDA